MDNLHSGLANGASVEYLGQRPPPSTDDQAANGDGGSAPAASTLVHTFDTVSMPGVKVHVLGPSRDPKVIASLKPPKGQYYEFVDSRPVPRSQVSRPALFADDYLLKGSRRRAVDSSDFVRLRDRAFDPAYAAKQLEDMVNGTSLVLALEIGDAVVILGGDAEWGTWETMLDDPIGRSLLERTTVYKVSHHGSYNGTPRRYVESLMPNNAISLVSLCHMADWPSIPRVSLLADLATHQRQVVRTDQPASGGAVVERNDLFTEVAVAI